MRRYRQAPLVALAVAVGIVAWWLLARAAGPLLLPEPMAVLGALANERSRLAVATLHTGGAALSGLALAVGFGVGAAVASWWHRALAAALVPYTVLVQVIPIVAIAPILVVWLGYGSGVAMVTAAVAAFYPIYSASTTGLASPSADLVDLFRLYRATRAQELLRLRLPASLPALFSGLRSAGGLAVIGAIVGEFVGSNGLPPTLGNIILYSPRAARMDLCFAAVTASAVLALTVHAGLRALEVRLTGRWFGS